jgi:trimeric autotransporter adhesin
MNKFGLSALVSPRVLVGVGLVTLTSLFGGTGCVSYSLTGLYIEPGTNLTCVPNGGTAQYKAYGTYTEGGHSMEIEDISTQVSWSVTTPQLATISSSGLATANDGVMTNGTIVVYDGTSSIAATTEGEFGNLTNYSNIEVSGSCAAAAAIAKPFSLHVVAGNQPLTVGDTLRPLAVATWPEDGHTQDLTSKAVWSSSNPAVATVDSHGTIAAVAPGDATITAEVKSPSGETVTTTQPLHFVAQQN